MFTAGFGDGAAIQIDRHGLLLDGGQFQFIQFVVQFLVEHFEFLS